MSEFVFYVKRYDEVLAGFNNFVNAEMFLSIIKRKVFDEMIDIWVTENGIYISDPDDWLHSFYLEKNSIQAKIDAAYIIDFNPEDLEDIPFA